MRRFLCIQTGNPRMDERQFPKFPVSEKKIKIEGVAGGAATPSPLFACWENGVRDGNGKFFQISHLMKHKRNDEYSTR